MKKQYSLFKLTLRLLVAGIFLLSIFFAYSSPAHATAKPQSPPVLHKIWGCDEIYRDLRLDSPPLKGKDILELERRLQQLGFNPGNVDEIFDSATQLAVQKFQIYKNLQPTGVVDLATWEALGENCEQPVTGKTPPPQGRIKIVIDRNTRKLTIYDNGQPYKQYPVAIGENDTPSPVGEWKIVSKGVNWGTGFGTRWLGLNVPWGIYGIHGTNKPWTIGTAASHGCFRMFNRHVEEIYSWVKVGTPVIVKGNVTGLRQRNLKAGNTGQDVVIVQLRLREEKLLWTPADGRFGPATEKALKLFQMLYGLELTGQVNSPTWEKILTKE